jgi:hypothetical protein
VAAQHRATLLVSPPGFASLNDVCSRGLAPLSDAQLEAAYAAAAPSHLRTSTAAQHSAVRRMLSGGAADDACIAAASSSG